MRIGRTISALLIGLAVAMQPLAGGIAAPKGVPSTSQSVTSAHDCCDHDCVPVDNAITDCQAAAGCTAKCFSLVGVDFSSPIIHPPVTGAEPPFATKNFRSQTGSAPFRPPRA